MTEEPPGEVISYIYIIGLGTDIFISLFLSIVVFATVPANQIKGAWSVTQFSYGHNPRPFNSTVYPRKPINVHPRMSI